MRVAIPQLVLRLALVGILTVILQVSAVTQLQIFGTNADLMPLVIAAVGLLAGSIAGACFGFTVGLFLDLALVQTVGLSSLVYVAVGYWAGRFRELRDPQSALVPLAVGAAATAAAMTSGMRSALVPKICSCVTVETWRITATMPRRVRRRMS